MPHAAGLGGDLLALVREPGGEVRAINATGAAPSVAPRQWTADGGGSVTVPGLVDGWLELHRRWGVRALEDDLGPALALAREGWIVDDALSLALHAQRSRLEAHGAGEWSLLHVADGDRWRQPELAQLLADVAKRGRAAFYSGTAAAAMVAASAGDGGTLSTADMATHGTQLPEPVRVDWASGSLWVQPPASQGVLLAMAARWVDGASDVALASADHALIEATEAAFMFRDRAAGDPAELLQEELDVDLLVARHRGGPRGYLHTAGVAVADGSGLVVSSLVSVFDDFGSAVYVPELGIVLNNRAAGFTSGANAARPGARPVHTLAPILLVDSSGDPLALATPGADGQVQTLLQVLVALRSDRRPLTAALHAPRWRSQSGRLLIETGHPSIADLVRRGHDLDVLDYGDALFGAVVAAGVASGQPYAAADPRRDVTGGVLE